MVEWQGVLLIYAKAFIEVKLHAIRHCLEVYRRVLTVLLTLTELVSS